MNYHLHPQEPYIIPNEKDQVINVLNYKELLGGNMKKQEVTKIYKSKDYDEFIADTKYSDDTRVLFLMLQAQQRDEMPPLVVVKKEDGKLKVISEQDSFFAAKRLGLPVYYYEAYPMTSYAKPTFDLSYSDMQAMLSYCLDHGIF